MKRKKKEERAKEKQRIEQEQQEKKKRLEEEKAEKERMAKEKERIAKEEKERKEREKEREKAEEERKKREKAEQERKAKEEAERKKAQEEEERRKKREREEAERLQKQKMKQEEKRREEDKKRKEELIRRLSSEEVPKEVEIVETRRNKSDTSSTSSDSDSDSDDNGAKVKAVERKVHAMVGRFTQPGRRAPSPPRDATSPPGGAAASSEQSVERLIDQFTNLKDADLEGEARRGKVALELAADGDEAEDRRASDVASLVQKFRKMNARRRSSSSSSSSDSDGGRASPEKPKPAPIPTIPARTSVPGKVRTLRADELRFFETSGGDGGATEPFMRTQSLRGKKSESSSFAKPRFGSLRGGKSRVAVISTSSSTNAALPKNCRRLNKDELRFFEGEVTNIYRSRTTSDRDGKTTRGEGRPPAAPQDNTLPDSEVFFRLAGRGEPAPKGTSRPAPREDDSDSDSEPSVLRGSEELTDSEGDLYELDITLRSETDTDDTSDTEGHALDHPMSLLVHSIQGKLLHPVDASGAGEEDTRCYVVFSPSGYLDSSGDEDDDHAYKFPLASPTLTENVSTPTLTENRGPPVVALDEGRGPAAPSQAVLPDPAAKGTKAEANDSQHLESTRTITEQTLKTSSQATVNRHTENGDTIDLGDTEGSVRPLLTLDNQILKTDTLTENIRSSKLLLTRGKGVEDTDSSDEDEKKEERKNNEKDIKTSVMEKSVNVEVVLAKNEANTLETKQLRPLLDPDEKVDHDAMEVFMEELDKLNSLPRPIKALPPREDPKTLMNASDSSSDSSSDDEEGKREKEEVQEVVVPAKKGANTLETTPPRLLFDPDEKVDHEALETFMQELEKLNAPPRPIKALPPREDPKTTMNVSDSSSGDSSSDESSSEDEEKREKKQEEKKKRVTAKKMKEEGKQVKVQELVVVAKKEGNALKTKQPRPRVDPDDEVDEEALEAFLEELEKLNALPQTIKPSASSQDLKTPMNADDSSSDSSSDDERLTYEDLKSIEEQIIPVDASPLLLEHSKRQKEEEKMVKETIQQTCSSPPLSEPLERKDIETGIGRESAVQRGETGEREENTDLMSGREFIKFCIFSIWFSVIMYMTKDLLS